jgi:soluble lytic murein transglycosylase
MPASTPFHSASTAGQSRLVMRLVPLLLLVACTGADSSPGLIAVGLYSIEPLASTRIRMLVEERAPTLDLEESKRITQAILDSSQREQIDPLFVVALIEVESEFVAQAQSKKGAVGLLQMMPATLIAQAKLEGIEVDAAALARDPSLGITLGLRYLASLRKRFGGDLASAVMAYNAGPTRFRFAKATGTQEPYEAYLKNVKRHFAILKTQFHEPPDFAGALLVANEPKQ